MDSSQRLRRVGFWWRALALLIDFVICTFLIFLMLLTVEIVSARTIERQRLIQNLIIGCLLIYTCTEVVFAGTPGKRILGLKIGCNNGTSADIWRLILRWSTKQSPLLLSLIFFATNLAPFDFLLGLSATVILIGCLFASNDDRLTWHDQWAGTAVYRARDLDIPLARRQS